MNYLAHLNLLFIFIFVVLNIFCLFLVGYDKKRAIRNQWRVAEKTFFTLAFMGGALGMYLGMIFFRHKTKHFHLKWGIRFLMALNGVVFYFLFSNIQ